MPAVPLPDRGQPLDVTYIYSLASAINDVASQVSSASYNFTSVFTKEVGKQDLKTSQTKFVAGYVDIISNDDVQAGSTRSFSFTYPTDFKYSPIVTATVVNNGTSEIGDDVTVTIRSVTTSRVDGVVKFNKSGRVSTSVNIIVVGVPT